MVQDRADGYLLLKGDGYVPSELSLADHVDDLQLQPVAFPPGPAQHVARAMTRADYLR